MNRKFKVPLQYDFGTPTAGQTLISDANGVMTLQTPATGVTTLAALSDTAITTPIAGNILVHDGTDSFDNVALSGDVTITAAGVATTPRLDTLVGGGAGAANLGTFTGGLLSDNEDVKTLFQEIETAVEAITGDGNHSTVVRANTTTGVAPTAGEVASPINGDTAAVYLTDGVKEVWAHNGTAWSLAFTRAADAAVNLGYTASPTNGLITNTDGTDSTVLAATGTNAGLLLPADFIKLGFISVTEAINLDTVTNKYPETFGDATATTFTINHALAEQDVLVQVREVATGEKVECGITYTDANNVELEFTDAPAVNEFRVVVIG